MYRTHRNTRVWIRNRCSVNFTEEVRTRAAHACRSVSASTPHYSHFHPSPANADFHLGLVIFVLPSVSSVYFDVYRAHFHTSLPTHSLYQHDDCPHASAAALQP